MSVVIHLAVARLLFPKNMNRRWSSRIHRVARLQVHPLHKPCVSTPTTRLLIFADHDVGSPGSRADQGCCKRRSCRLTRRTQPSPQNQPIAASTHRLKRRESKQPPDWSHSRGNGEQPRAKPAKLASTDTQNLSEGSTPPTESNFQRGNFPQLSIWYGHLPSLVACIVGGGGTPWSSQRKHGAFEGEGIPMSSTWHEDEQGADPSREDPPHQQTHHRRS